MRLNVLLRSASLVGVLIVLQGCPGTIDDPQSFLVNRTDGGTEPDAMTGCDVVSIFADTTTGCAGSSCHVGGPIGPSLEPGNFGNLNTDSAFCAGHPFVDPGNPMNSAVYLKLLPDGMRDNCSGGKMPSGRELAAGELECIREWIEGMQ